MEIVSTATSQARPARAGIGAPPSWRHWLAGRMPALRLRIDLDLAPRGILHVGQIQSLSKNKPIDIKEVDWVEGRDPANQTGP